MAAYAFIVAALLIEKPTRIDDIIRLFRVFAAAYIAAPVVMMFFGPIAPRYLPA
jgi:hypothetical protein